MDYFVYIICWTAICINIWLSTRVWDYYVIAEKCLFWMENSYCKQELLMIFNQASYDLPRVDATSSSSFPLATPTRHYSKEMKSVHWIFFWLIMNMIFSSVWKPWRAISLLTICREGSRLFGMSITDKPERNFPLDWFM